MQTSWKGKEVKSLTKDIVVPLLREGVCFVTFESVKDGSEKKMLVTLNTKEVPEEQLPKTGGATVEESSDLVKAYSLDRGAWRAFHISTVKSFRKIETYTDYMNTMFDNFTTVETVA